MAQTPYLKLAVGWDADRVLGALGEVLNNLAGAFAGVRKTAHEAAAYLDEFLALEAGCKQAAWRRYHRRYTRHACAAKQPARVGKPWKGL